MNQISIFDAPRHPRVRNTDPRSSHDAVTRGERTGRIDASRKQVLAALKLFAMHSSAELSKASGIDRTEVARRLPEIARDGDADRYDPTPETVPCAVTGIRCVRWCAK